ncbi:MAG: acylphosphatase, partial [Candidatus Methanoperedens sp.]|nr:acylphosphatase [Candidatus Methanoperedens sp.]
IEGTARKLDVKGYVSNDIDGSVKIACEGLQKSVDAFINSIKEFTKSDIERIEKKEIHEELYLPSIFSRVATDDYYEFSKKFDIGLDYLDGIKTDTGEIKSTLGEMNSTLGEVKGSLNSMDNKLSGIDNTLAKFVKEQGEHNLWMKEHLIKMDEHNHWMKEHNQRLEKILEKLTER